MDDEGIKAQFSDWARKGGGRYLDAHDEDGLRAALREAIASHYRIKRGVDVVAQGTVNGPPVELSPGTYRIVTDLGDLRTVQLDSGIHLELKLE